MPIPSPKILDMIRYAGRDWKYLKTVTYGSPIVKPN